MQAGVRSAQGGKNLQEGALRFSVLLHLFQAHLQAAGPSCRSMYTNPQSQKREHICWASLRFKLSFQGTKLS